MTTRIADLPENVTMQLPSIPTSYSSNLSSNDGGEATNYVPINIHPNPYGISAQNPILPNPISVSSPQQQQQIQHYQQQTIPQHSMSQQPTMPSQMPNQGMQPQNMQIDYENMPQRRLPSRDIPIDTSNYLHDEQITANYVPKPKLTADYVREHAGNLEEKLKENESKKHRASKLDQLLTELQIPIMVCFLFFVYQLPIVNTMIFKKMSFLSVYNEDGNFNMYGLLLKSILFGMSFYSLTKFSDFLSSI